MVTQLRQLVSQRRGRGGAAAAAFNATGEGFLQRGRSAQCGPLLCFGRWLRFLLQGTFLQGFPCRTETSQIVNAVFVGYLPSKPLGRAIGRSVCWVVGWLVHSFIRSSLLSESLRRKVRVSGFATPTKYRPEVRQSNNFEDARSQDSTNLSPKRNFRSS